MQAVSDEQLIARVAGGESSCLGTLFERHHRGVYRYCRQLTRHGAQAEDLVQEVFLKILRKAGTELDLGTVMDGTIDVAGIVGAVSASNVNGGGPVVRLKTLNGDINIVKTGNQAAR